MSKLIRCTWAENTSPEYIKYHDEEWGVAVHDDKIHFEFLILESAQAGLSWATILKRREGYRKAFADFDPVKVARFDEYKVQELLQFKGIIRNKLKVRAAINNAQKFLEIQEEFGSFDNYVWRFVNGKPIVGNWETSEEVPTTTAQSEALSKDLKKPGFKFVGSAIIYAYMQACRLVNDHIVQCFRYAEILKNRI